MLVTSMAWLWVLFTVVCWMLICKIVSWIEASNLATYVSEQWSSTVSGKTWCVLLYTSSYFNTHVWYTVHYGRWEVERAVYACASSMCQLHSDSWSNENPCKTQRRILQPSPEPDASSAVDNSSFWQLLPRRRQLWRQRVPQPGADRLRSALQPSATIDSYWQSPAVLWQLAPAATVSFFWQSTLKIVSH